MKRPYGPIAAAAAAVVGCVLLGSLQSVAWHGADAPLVAQTIAGWLDPGLAFEAASSGLENPSESYFGYGRWVVGLYALMLWAAMSSSRLLTPRMRWFMAALIALAIGGDVTAYWVSESAGPNLRRLGFWYTEVPALVTMVALLTGVGAWRIWKGGAGRILVACLPVCLATTALLGYLPHGILLGLGLTASCTLVAPASEALRERPATAPLPRWARVLLTVAIVIGSLLLIAMYRPVLRSGPEISASPWVGSDELEGARLHVFNTGYNKMSRLLVGRERPWRPVPAFVIEYPEEGLLVFDTGLSDAVAELGEAGLHIPERWVIESRSRKPLMLPAQMRKAGLDADAVHHVAISHLHGDHVGQLEAFPHSKFIAGPGSAAWGRDHGFDERWQELTWDSATPYGPFDGTVQMPGDRGGVFVRGGGHAHEGLMLLLALDHGPVLLAGDAVVHSDWLRSNDVQRIPVDPDRAAVVRNQVRSFASEVPGSVVVYGHDLRDLDCTRPDIVCHGAARFHPEGEDSPLP